MISYKCPVFYLRHSNFMAQTSSYTEENIKSLDWKEHIRMRPGMYIGKLGDGSAYDDGIYILLRKSLTIQLMMSWVLEKLLKLILRKILLM